MVILSIQMAVLQPASVARVVESGIFEVLITVILVILQIPNSILQTPFFAQQIPEANTVWDSIVRVLLLLFPLPSMTIAMANLRFRMSRQREQMYRNITKKSRRHWAENNNMKVVLSQEQRTSVIHDILSTLFIIAFLFEGYPNI